MAPFLSRANAAGLAALLAAGACAAQPSASGTQPERLYRDYCSVCHGDRGDGRSRARASLAPAPRDFTDPALREKLPRSAMIAIVRDGKPGTAMVGWKTQLRDGDIEAVVDYIRATFMSPEARAAPSKSTDMSLPLPGGLVGDASRGARFYAANCVPCHGAAGDGRGPRAYFIRPGPRNFLDPAARASLNRPALFAAIAMGKPGTEMSAWRNVADEQRIADVAEYVFVQFISK